MCGIPEWDIDKELDDTEITEKTEIPPFPAYCVACHKWMLKKEDWPHHCKEADEWNEKYK